MPDKEHNIQSFYEKIDSAFDSLTPAQQKALRYIKRNWEQVCLMTAKEVGVKAEVSEATVQRVSLCLGYQSFRDMKTNLKRDLLQYRAMAKFSVKSGRDDAGWLAEHVSTEIANLHESYRKNPPETFEKAAAILGGSQRIWVIGGKMGAGVSAYLQFALNYLLGRTVLLDLSTCPEFISFMGKEDTLLVVGFQRYCKDTLQAEALAKDRGAAVIAFTDCDLSPFAKLADAAFYVQTESVLFLDSYSAALSLAQALLAEIVEQNRQRIGRSVAAAEEIYHAMQ